MLWPQTENLQMPNHALECCGAGARKVLGEVQPGMRELLLGVGQRAPPTCLSGTQRATAPFPEPWGPQWMLGPSLEPLLPAPGGPSCQELWG